MSQEYEPFQSVHVQCSTPREPFGVSRSTFANHQESDMNSPLPLAIVASLIFSVQLASAQDLSRYRTYALESSLDAVITTSGARAVDARTLHERPARIQELQWRTPYTSSGDKRADPVREIYFSFYDNALYQMVVNYDRDRTEGLTNDDLIGSLSVAYGAPTIATAKAGTMPPPEAFPDSIVIARWDSADSLITLIRGTYTPELKLILMSKPLSARAQSAIREAIRLELVDAPRRAAEQHQKEAGDASAALDKARIANKAAFRP